jgi:hypothetical protein
LREHGERGATLAAAVRDRLKDRRKHVLFGLAKHADMDG